MSKSKRVIGLRIAGLCGVASPVIMLASIFLSISYSPWFSWTENALSDLGVRGNAAIIFNSSLIVGGLLTIIFALGLQEILRSRTLSHAGSLILVLAAASLCAIGIFPETAGDLHTYVSVAFFTLLPISLFFIGAAIIQEPSERNLGFFTVLAGVVMPVVWMLPWGEGVAIPEMLASLAASLWSIVWGTTLFRRFSFNSVSADLANLDWTRIDIFSASSAQQQPFTLLLLPRSLSSLSLFRVKKSLPPQGFRLTSLQQTRLDRFPHRQRKA